MKTEIHATYTHDSKKYHKYVIDQGQEAVGTLYFSKEMNGVPEEVILKLKVKEHNG